MRNRDELCVATLYDDSLRSYLESSLQLQVVETSFLCSRRSPEWGEWQPCTLPNIATSWLKPLIWRLSTTCCSCACGQWQSASDPSSQQATPPIIRNATSSPSHLPSHPREDTFDTSSNLSLIADGRHAILRQPTCEENDESTESPVALAWSRRNGDFTGEMCRWFCVVTELVVIIPEQNWLHSGMKFYNTSRGLQYSQTLCRFWRKF